MEKVSGQIGRLWSLVGDLQAISGNGGAARLQEILAKLNGELGEIDRNTREFVVVTKRRKAAIENIATVNERMLGLMTPVADRIGSRLTGTIGNAGADSAQASTDLGLLRTAYAVRADVNRSAELLARAAAAPDVTSMSIVTAELGLIQQDLREGVDVLGGERAHRHDAEGSVERDRGGDRGGFRRRRASGAAFAISPAARDDPGAAEVAPDDERGPARTGRQARAGRRAGGRQHHAHVDAGANFEPLLAGGDFDCEPRCSLA